MGALVDGKWEYEPIGKSGGDGRFERQETTFRDQVEDREGARFAPESGRYHLYVSYACPWAHRTLIARKLKGLEPHIDLSVVDPLMGPEGWAFGDDPDGMDDPVNGARYLREVYLAADPRYTGRVSVPVLWDKREGTIVSNESSEILRMFNSAFDRLPGVNAELDLYPAPLRAEIDRVNDGVYTDINNGVYRNGFAGTQAAYEEAFDALFARLDETEERLSHHRYLVGDRITEADWRLFVTLVRFDAVYVAHFRCNLRRIADYPNLSNYLRELYQMPGVAETVNIRHIKEHYFRSHESLNPKGIVPKGPELNFDLPHDRGRLLAA
ncbi:glutathione S-transferase family protein [Nisaea acidiphila]|uniref:Glutathione S-transferase family protein n=1 Tax=Nisaea acidiphila TaxID=1862145 RepID=A0A9J7AP98_9PROT|nr:glutathione S-transferase family protein [Nisaea acidiphila]UUX49443.1 glutathione S-transferase family protein [Nisaea acidiphila]